MKKKDNSSSKFSKTKSNPFWRWFWLTFLVVSLAYAWYSFYVPSSPMIWAKNITSVEKLTNDSSNNKLLFFTGKWCSPCRIMRREVFTDKEVTKAITLKVTPVMINIDDPNTKGLINHYMVNTTPTTIITDAEGKVIDKVVGKIEKKKFLEMLSNLEPN